MSRTESTYSERVGARISPELKMGLRELVETGVFDSEADAVREALWQYVEQQAGQADTPSPGPGSAINQPARVSSAEWLMSALFMLVALVGSHILNALRTETVTPSQLADEAIQETIYNHQILQHKLDVARQVAEKMDKLELHDHREAETG